MLVSLLNRYPAFVIVVNGRQSKVHIWTNTRRLQMTGIMTSAVC
jgi:hypothetical protein